MSREQRIRERAFQIWESEGKPQGCDAEHWRRAEIDIDKEQPLRGSARDVPPLPPAASVAQSAPRPVRSQPAVEQASESVKPSDPTKKKTRNNRGALR